MWSVSCSGNHMPSGSMYLLRLRVSLAAQPPIKTQNRVRQKMSWTHHQVDREPIVIWRRSSGVWQAAGNAALPPVNAKERSLKASISRGLMRMSDFFDG